MSELQPGMLALVIGFTNVPDNVGKVVTVNRYANTGDEGVGKAIYGGSGAWMVSGERLTLVHGSKKIIGDFAFIKAKHLIPIRPEADPLHEKQQQELHA